MKRLWSFHSTNGEIVCSYCFDQWCRDDRVSPCIQCLIDMYCCGQPLVNENDLPALCSGLFSVIISTYLYSAQSTLALLVSHQAFSQPHTLSAARLDGSISHHRTHEMSRAMTALRQELRHLLSAECCPLVVNIVSQRLSSCPAAAKLFLSTLNAAATPSDSSCPSPLLLPSAVDWMVILSLLTPPRRLTEQQHRAQHTVKVQVSDMTTRTLSVLFRESLIEQDTLCLVMASSKSFSCVTVEKVLLFCSLLSNDFQARYQPHLHELFTPHFAKRLSVSFLTFFTCLLQRYCQEELL